MAQRKSFSELRDKIIFKNCFLTIKFRMYLLSEIEIEIYHAKVLMDTC